MAYTLTKPERLSGKTAVSALIHKGRWGVCEPLRYCFLPGNGCGHSRILLAVPKKLFKRAVKRNLLKRRLREAYRTQKDLLPSSAGVDLLLSYSSSEIMSSAALRECVAAVLRQVAARASGASVRSGAGSVSGSGSASGSSSSSVSDTVSGSNSDSDGEKS